MASPSSSIPSPPPLLSPQPDPPPKKAAPLPWSHPETLALIQAYQEKWYSAKKGPLKSSQWEEIAVTVAVRCGLDEPSRTSTQCRHKMEKLRKRYRSDLRKPYPNSWPYFDLMDQLERGPMPLTARPIKASPPGYEDNGNKEVNCDYGGFRLGCTGYLEKSNNLAGGSDVSDEEWNQGYCVGTYKKSRSMRIYNNNNNNNNNGGGNVLRRLSRRRVGDVNRKRKNKYYGDDENSEEEWEDDDGGGEREVAAEIRSFAERLMRVENEKIEMVREREEYLMEMEKKRMDMILENHSKIMSCIRSAFNNIS